MTFVNHHGKWVDSEEPVTGVLNNNQIRWEWIESKRAICLTCRSIEEEIMANTEDDQEERERQLDDVTCEGYHTQFLGDWKHDGDYEYYPDRDKEWAAVQRETTLQVVWSKTTTRGALCSPCYPGQVDLGSTGKFLAFTLPDELLYMED